MSTPIEFTGNYEDLSTDLGFQFKFYCERCGNGYMSSYERSTLGTAGSLLSGASRLLGGVFDHVADASYEINRAVGSPAHDAALRRAVQEIRQLFQQCPSCGQWACGQVCWNPHAKMCKGCAPVAEEVETRMRAQHVEEQVTNDLFLEENRRMSAQATLVAGECAACGAKTLGKKFCPGCGKPTGAAPAFCGDCGARATPGAKFCGECGGAIER
jgi:ribosomal protein L32